MSPQTRAFLAISNGICVLATSSIHSCQLAGRSAIMQGWRQLCVRVWEHAQLSRVMLALRSFVFLYLWHPPERKLWGLALSSYAHLSEKYEELCESRVCLLGKNRSRSPIFFFWLCYRGWGGRSVLEVNNSAESHGLSRCLLGKRFTHSNRDQTRPSQRKEQAHWVLHHGLQGGKIEYE